MIKHGTSHGLSVLICTILSAFLIEVIRPLFPDVVEKTKSYTQPLLKAMRIPISPDYFNILILSVVLAIIWGIFFKLRYDK